RYLVYPLSQMNFEIGGVCALPACRRALLHDSDFEAAQIRHVVLLPHDPCAIAHSRTWRGLWNDGLPGTAPENPSDEARPQDLHRVEKATPQTATLARVAGS